MNRSASRGAGGDRRRPRALLLVLVAVPCIACGVKGPPLPPLVRVPAAPKDLTAERRGDRVDLRFLVPAENTDGSRPANIERVDVYALTGPTNVSDEVLLKRGTRIASVEVKAPRDPDATVEPGDPISDVEPPEGSGLDQGAVADVHEDLDPAALQPVDVTEAASSADGQRPLALVGPVGAPSRTFVGVGVSTRRRRGPISRRAVVTLTPAPPAPAQPSVTYDETSMKVTWVPAAAGAPEKAASSQAVLPSRTFGIPTRAIASHVYEVKPPGAASGSARPADSKLPETASEIRLTKTPITEGAFVDKRIEWGVERCYTVRVVWTFGELSVESDAAPPRCTTPTDTFRPAAPTGLTPIPSEGAITLIWNPNAEGDVAGYVVLRSVSAVWRAHACDPYSHSADHVQGHGGAGREIRLRGEGDRQSGECQPGIGPGRGGGTLAARGESLASHRDGRGAPPARRDDREYREYLSEEQRSRRGCIARRMQPDFCHGLLR